MSGYVLLAEDSFLAALEMKAMLTDLGYTVLGPAATSVEALALLEETPEIAFAVLDVSLRGGNCAPIIHKLHSFGRPFLLATGYASPELGDELPSGLAELVILRKPVVRALLLSAIDKIVG